MDEGILIDYRKRGLEMSILSSTEIAKKCTLNSTYSRGKSLFRNHKVHSLIMKKTQEKNMKFTARVEGNSSESYHTSIEVEAEDRRKAIKVKSFFCECPAFATYGGFCKHLCATMLEINDDIEEADLKNALQYWNIGEFCDISEDMEDTFKQFSLTWDQSAVGLSKEGTDFEPEEDDSIYDFEYNSQYAQEEDSEDDFYVEEKSKQFFDKYLHQSIFRDSGSAPATASGRNFSYGNKAAELTSSKALLDAISGVVLQERNQFCQEVANGDVDLEVTLHLEVWAEKLELRIGKKQMYIVKNIEELVGRIRSQSVYRYGKNLEFVHTQSAFTKESLELVSFLLDVEFGKSGYYYSRSADNRYLELDGHMLDEILRMYEGKYLPVQNCLDHAKSDTLVVQENPQLPVQIQGKEGGVMADIIFSEILLLEGVRKFYIWWQNCIYICSESYCREMKEIVKLMAVNYSRAERKNRDRYYYGYISKNQKLELCEKDYASFCATLLPLLEKYMEVEVKGIDFSQYQVEEGGYEIYLDIAENQEIICQAKAIYGKRQHSLTETAAVQETYRDIRTEYEIRTLLSQYFPERTADHQAFLLRNDDDRLAQLVENGIDRLKDLAEVFVSEEFKKIRIASQVTISTGLSIRGNLLNVTWDVEGMSKEELYDILGSYSRKKKYHRLRSGELLNLSDSGLDIFADMQEDLHLSKAQLKAGMAEVPIYRALYMNALMKENAKKIRVSRDEMFEKLVQGFDSLQEKQFALPQEVQAGLREYQIEGYRWACSLTQLGFGGILADDMGLGKTLQMITYLCHAKGPVHLVVCPSSLVYNWEAEFHKFAPAMRVCLMIGNVEERAQLIEHYQEYDVVVTSYDLLKRDIDHYVGKHFGCEIIDEAQYIKNPTTQAAKAVKSIESRNRFALTGTPIENRLSELWSIFEYLMPGYLYSYKHFKENFEEKILQHSKEEEKALNKIHTMIRPFLLRRLKKEVLKDLPDKIEEVVYTKFGKEQEKLYKATEKNVVMNLKKKSGKEIQENKLQILAELTKLRQICCDPGLLYGGYQNGSAKLDTCMELISNALEGGHKILLFSQFATMLEILSAKLQQQGVRHFLLRGSTTKRKRKEMVEQFQGGKADVFLISLKAGGTGLNLTAADMVIHYDPWWNVAAQNQATDRTHRIGQENNVTVFKLITRDTIEERILKLQEMKQDLADKIISAEGVSLSTLTKEEILGLFEE